MRTSQALQPPWMPQPNTLDILPAGRWWDAIAVPQQPGLSALQILDAASHREPGPVIWEPVAAAPRLYFLVAAGSAEAWKMAGTSALGAGCFVGIPGPTTIEPPGIHWLVPPDPDKPSVLVDAQALREALLRVTEEAA
jgi:hypothetical protein